MSPESVTRDAGPNLGKIRLQETTARPALEQILALRALAWSGTISLSPDVLRWGDAGDTRAFHWCVFNDAELIATGRMSIHSSLDDVADRELFEPLAASIDYPVAMMSHGVVHPRFRGLHLLAALDAARIERARQLRLPRLLAAADERRATHLRELGFTEPEGLGVRAKLRARRGGRRGLILDLAPRRDDGNVQGVSPA